MDATSRASLRFLAMMLGCLGLAVALSGCASGSRPSQSSHRSAVPRGFDPVSFAAGSERDYWVLGTTPCRAGRCYRVIRTRDAGRTFTTAAAPPLATQGVVPTIHFADRRNGFIFVPPPAGALLATRDGGTSWRRLRLGTVLGFATGGTSAYAVTAHCSARGCVRLRLRRSPGWTARALPFGTEGSLVALAAQASRVWLLGGAQGREARDADEVARSGNAGRTFEIGPGPCVAELGGTLFPTSTDTVWAVCATGMSAEAFRSTNGGATFADLITPPLTNGAVLAPASRKTAVLFGNGGLAFVRTTDGGATWARTRAPRPVTSIFQIGFVDSRVGVALVQTRRDPPRQELWRTTDAGASWSTIALR